MSTLIIGTRCKDGVVLAADRRELRGYEPTKQSKIRRVELEVGGTKVSVLLAGAGVAAFWDEVAWSLSHSTKAGLEPEVNTLLDVVDRVSSLSINMAARYQRGSLDEPLGCVMAGLDRLTTGEAELYCFAGAGFSKTDFICLGSGETYALPVADLLLHQPALSTNQATQATQIFPFLFLLVERVNLSVGEGLDIFIVRDGEQAVQLAANQVEDTRIKASNLLETLPDAFLKVVENPAILQQLL